jgi:DNA-directed RNA polymerase specialized sigma24 family protein
MAIAFDPDSEVRTAPRIAYDEAVRQHRGALRACARRLLEDDAEAEVVVEEVLAAAPRALALFRPAGSLGCWLQGVTIGAVLARRRAGSRSEPR